MDNDERGVIGDFTTISNITITKVDPKKSKNSLTSL